MIGSMELKALSDRLSLVLRELDSSCLYLWVEYRGNIYAVVYLIVTVNIKGN